MIKGILNLICADNLNIIFLGALIDTISKLLTNKGNLNYCL